MHANSNNATCFRYIQDWIHTCLRTHLNISAANNLLLKQQHREPRTLCYPRREYCWCIVFVQRHYANRSWSAFAKKATRDGSERVIWLFCKADKFVQTLSRSKRRRSVRKRNMVWGMMTMKKDGMGSELKSTFICKLTVNLLLIWNRFIYYKKVYARMTNGNEVNYFEISSSFTISHCF